MKFIFDKKATLIFLAVGVFFACDKVETPQFPPVAVKDSTVIDRGDTVEIAVLMNDYDENGDDLYITLDTTATYYGKAKVNEDEQSIIYTPYPCFEWTDTVFYNLHDGNGNTDVGVVNITVVAEEDFYNHRPFAADDYRVTTKNTPANIFVLQNDNDYESYGVKVHGIESPPKNGQAIVMDSLIHKERGYIRYTPKPDFVGKDSLVYICSDYCLHDWAMVYIEVKEE